MPKYRVQLSDGRVVTVEGTQPPTEADILAQLGRPVQAPKAPVETPDESSWADTAINALPTIGGTVGSFAGAGKWNPLGMAGAAVGGVAGEALKQTANALRGRMDLVPSSTGEQLKSMAAAGAVQGGVEGVGRGIVAPVAKSVYGVAMRPIKWLRDKYGLKTLVTEGFERGVLPTSGGAARAGRAMTASKAKQRGMAEAYDAAGGTRVSPFEAGQVGVAPLVREARAAEVATGAPTGAEQITKQWRTVSNAHPTGMSAQQMMDAKHAADAIADPAYLAARRAGGVVDPASTPGIAKGWSKGYRETLNEAVGPAFAKQGRTTKALFGVQRMASEAAERPNMLTNMIAGAVATPSALQDPIEGAKSFLLYRGLMDPRVMAGTALAAKPLALYGTRALDAATGSNVEQMMREALLARMRGGAPR